MRAALERPPISQAMRHTAKEPGRLRSISRNPAAIEDRAFDQRAYRYAELPAEAPPVPQGPTGGSTEVSTDGAAGGSTFGSMGHSMRNRLIAAVLALGLLPALLAGAAAYVSSHYVAETWVGRSELIFHLPELSGDAASRFLATQPVIVASYPLVEPIAGVERLPVEEVTRGLSASLVQGSTLMRIEYRDTDQARILRVLEGLTEGYLTLLRDMALVEGASHRLLSAPFLLEEPVGPRPMRAAAIGAVIGLAVAFAGLVVTAQLRRPG